MPGRQSVDADLVHDAGGHADVLVLGPLGERAATSPRRPGRQAGRGRPARRATAHSSAADEDSPAPSGTSSRSRASSRRHVDAGLAQRPGHADDVRRPAVDRAGRQVGDAERRPARPPARPDRPRRPSSAGRPPTDGAVRQRDRQHEAVVVVGVLTDQVDPARAPTRRRPARRPNALAKRLRRARRRSSHRLDLPQHAPRASSGADVVDERAHRRLGAGQVLQLAAARGGR